ncbi:MAG: beta-hexosaminidase, partial [Gammaproteobacteria bacterium]
MPRFQWRGAHLDVSRSFMPKEFVKKYIDLLALHKLNRFHWHLTDDQGWRIEIKRYPKLTAVGAWRRPAGRAGTDASGKPTRYGGYYTQEQIREIVAYAQARYVTIMPEIEMPGHAQAAIAAYPELGVTGKNPGASHDWGVHTYLYNVEDSTFIFLQNVLDEVMELFPSRYIHIGGDEAAKDQWQASARVQARMRKLGVANEAAMQAWFIKRIETFLAAHGRKLIGWDEILEGGLPPQATVMSWRGSKGAIEAAQQGHDVVLSPDPDLYLNNLPSDLPDEPAGRAHVVSLQNVYAFDPMPKELGASAAKHVLGAQANLWGEYLPTDASVTYATYPRAAALAEVLWSPAASHDWYGFLDRLVAQQARYRMLGIGYSHSAFTVRIDADFKPAAGNVAITLSNQAGFGTIHYTLDGSEPTPQSPRYTAPFNAPARGSIRASAFAQAQALADARSRALDPVALRHKRVAELALCNPTGGVQLRLPDDRPANDHRAAYPV